MLCVSAAPWSITFPKSTRDLTECHTATEAGKNEAARRATRRTPSKRGRPGVETEPQTAPPSLDPSACTCASTRGTCVSAHTRVHARACALTSRLSAEPAGLPSALGRWFWTRAAGGSGLARARDTKSPGDTAGRDPLKGRAPSPVCLRSARSGPQLLL